MYPSESDVGKAAGRSASMSSIDHGFPPSMNAARSVSSRSSVGAPDDKLIIDSSLPHDPNFTHYAHARMMGRLPGPPEHNSIPFVTLQEEALEYIGLYEEVFDLTEDIPEGMIRVWTDGDSHYHYDCTCGKRKPIRNLKAIQHHVSRHNISRRSGRYPCDKCERVFSHYLGLNSHQRTHKD
jgi:hypothetical protein